MDWLALWLAKELGGDENHSILWPTDKEILQEKDQELNVRLRQDLDPVKRLSARPGSQAETQATHGWGA
jgi:hypothetical protein